MLEKIVSFDKSAFVFLNGLGSENFDGFWLAMTKPLTWIPFFLFLIYLIHKKLGTKQTLFFLLFVGILVTFTDQTANIFKHGVQRLRPCNDPDIKDIIRIVKSSQSYSFFSAHASNSMGVAVFLFSTLKKHYHYTFFLFLWPLIFAYSRIYLGLHFPLDIICGYIFGITYGILIFRLYQKAQKRYFSESKS